MSPLRYENNCVCVCCYKDISCFAYWHHHVTHIKIMTTGRHDLQESCICPGSEPQLYIRQRWDDYCETLQQLSPTWHSRKMKYNDCCSLSETLPFTLRRFYSAINLWEIISGSASCLRHTAALLQEIPADLPQAANNYQTSRPANQRPRNTAEETTLYFIYCFTHCYMQIYAA